MKEEIKDLLHNLEKEREVRILYACESGSRAWGFPSPDSDFDVRFIYVQKEEKYLSIESGKDFIQFPPDPILDVVGYDLKKFLNFYRSTNVKVFEWLQSPIVYRMNEDFHSELYKNRNDYFSLKAGMHHYLGLGGSVFKMLDEAQPSLKKYLYALRAVLSALWILEKGECPPMVFREQRKIVSSAEVNGEIDAFLAIKKDVDESFTVEPNEVINNFLGEGLEKGKAAMVEEKHGDVQPLNALFRKLIKE